MSEILNTYIKTDRKKTKINIFLCICQTKDGSPHVCHCLQATIC